MPRSYHRRTPEIILEAKRQKLLSLERKMVIRETRVQLLSYRLGKLRERILKLRAQTEESSVVA